MNEQAGQIASGLNALMQQLDIVSHNIANANTTGFKRTMSSFQTELKLRMGALEPDQPLNTARVETRQVLDFSQGTLLHTDRSLDVGLDGKGFLVLETPEGPLYTRNGSLQLNLLGQIVDTAGRLVAGENGPIVIPPNISPLEIRIGADGTVSGQGAELGKLRLVDFGEQVNLLTPAGLGALKAPADVQPQPANGLTVRQGCQESSNVKIIQELVNMMSVSRLYETGMNLLRRQRENSQAMLSVANG